MLWSSQVVYVIFLYAEQRKQVTKLSVKEKGGENVDRLDEYLNETLSNYCILQMETDSWIENAANGLMGLQVE